MFRRILLLALASLFASAAAQADSLWDHNGSIMRLVAEGQGRAFYYEVPRPAMQAQGVKPGTLLFNGERVGNRYVGVARRFSADCDKPLAYRAQGVVVTETHVVMDGEFEIYERGCHPTGRFRHDRLDFRFIKNVN